MARVQQEVVLSQHDCRWHRETDGLAGLCPARADVLELHRARVPAPPGRQIPGSHFGDRDVVREATEHGALGYLLKPVDIPHLVPAIEAALVRGREISRLRESESRLGSALLIEQKTRTAVGVLMERHRLDRQAAFEALRQYARSTRRKISECAEEILTAVEQLNKVGTTRDGRNR